MNQIILKSPQAIEKPLLSEADRIIFLQETIDLFTRRRQGHLIHRCYLTPEALHFGGKFSSAPASYMKPGEKCVIANAGGPISDRARHPFGVIGIENGPGMETAMREKSAAFFSQLAGLHTWVGRELSPASIGIMHNVMGGELPNVRIVPDQADFLRDAFPSGLGKGRKVLAEFGMTRGNMEGFPEDGFPYDTIKADLLAHRSRLDVGDIYTFTFDCNQNGAEVEAAYNSEWTTLWGRQLLHAMKTELPIEGDFDPESYDFRCIWEKASHGGFNYMIAQRKMEFSIAGIPVSIEKGEGWGITNSFKMPAEMIEPLAKDTGYTVDMHHSNDRRVAMPALIVS